MTSRDQDPDRIENPDVEIGAVVNAERLRFKRKPEAEVEFRGGLRERDHHTELETGSGSERENLPDEVEPNVTYRDVHVGWRAAARLGDSERSEGTRP